MRSESVSIHHAGVAFASSYQIRNQSCPSDISNRLLSRLGLLLSLDHRDQGDVNLQKVSLPSTSFQLSHGLNEGRALDIANGATQFNDAHIGTLVGIVNRYSCNPLDPVLNCIRKMRHNLDGLSQIVTPTLTLNYVLIYFAGGDVILAGECDIEIALVVPEVEVDFSAIIKDKDFPVPVTASTMSRECVRQARLTLSVPWYQRRHSYTGRS
jgi:hypothetical protein